MTISGPAVARLPAVRIDEDTSFKVEKKKHGHQLRGERGNIKYTGREDREQRYCLAVKDKKSGKIELVEVPLIDVVCRMKDKEEEVAASADIRQSGIKNWIQRTSLGEAFGTKKAKSAIKDMERNRLDADMLDGMETAIVDTMKDTTAALPSQEERQQILSAERPIPPYDASTTNPRDIYPLDSIIPPREFSLLRVDELEHAQTPEERASFLPYKSSDFINSRITTVISEGVNVRHRLKILAYMSLLLAVYENRRVSNKQNLMEKLGSPPEIVVDGVLDRFTVSKAGKYGRTKDRSFMFDPFHLDKLLCYLLALALNIDNCQVDVNPIAHELGMKPVRLGELFRGLGCTLKTPTSAQAQERRLTATAAKSYKIAKLTAPLNLPEIAKRKR